METYDVGFSFRASNILHGKRLLGNTRILDGMVEFNNITPNGCSISSIKRSIKIILYSATIKTNFMNVWTIQEGKYFIYKAQGMTLIISWWAQIYIGLNSKQNPAYVSICLIKHRSVRHSLLEGRKECERITSGNSLILSLMHALWRFDFDFEPIYNKCCYLKSIMWYR